MKANSFNIKKLSAIVLVIFLILPVVAVCASADSAPAITATANWGDTDGDGVFEVGSAADLVALANKRATNKNYAGKTIILTADIDLNPGWDASTKTAPTNVWTSMFSFDGTIDGQGHSISGIYCSAADNASFITNLTGATVKNLKIKNSCFLGTGKNAAPFACAKDNAVLENVYVDAIVEAGAECAGGIVSWLYSSDASKTPKVTMTNCVFVGSVSARDIAGGILGINGNYTTTGIANAVAREAVLTDCANYGTVTAADCVAGVLGKAIGVATLTRCYNGGTVSTSATSSAALVNVQQSAAAAVALNDCYYLSTSASVGMTKNDTATQVTVNYDATAATELQTATSAELTAKAAFNAWGILSSSSAAMPKVALCLVTGHDYDTQTVDPTCSEKGYTACTCKNCGYSYHADFVDTVAHTEGEDWIIDKEPTEDAAGSRHKECTVCGEVLKNEIIKKLGGSTTTAKKEDVTTTPGTEDTSDDEKKGGCGSSLAIGGAMGITLLISLGFVVAKKKEND